MDRMRERPSKSTVRRVLIPLALIVVAILAALPSAAAAARRPPIFVDNYYKTNPYAPGGDSVLELSPSGSVQTIAGYPPLDTFKAITTARSGQVLVADRNGILRISPDSGRVRRIAHGPNVHSLTDITQARNGIIYGASSGCAPRCVGLGPTGVVKVNPKTGKTNLVAAGRPINEPKAITSGRRGQIYLADGVRRAGEWAGTILRLNRGTGKVRRIWTSIGLRRVSDIDYANGNLYLAKSATVTLNGLEHTVKSPAKVVRFNPRNGTRTVIARGGRSLWQNISVAANGDIYLTAYANGASTVERIKRGRHQAQIVGGGLPFNSVSLRGIAVGK
jgi:hypothetical protein